MLFNIGISLYLNDDIPWSFEARTKAAQTHSDLVFRSLFLSQPTAHVLNAHSQLAQPNGEEY